MMITALAEMPHAIPRLAHWFHDEWNVFDGRSTAQIERQLAENLNRDCIPITFVAHTNGDLLGTVSIDISDLAPFNHLSPWLASLYVRPAARSTGIGSALVPDAQQFILSRGIRTLYLWTPGSIHLYERCGGAVFQRTFYNSRSITLMRFRVAERRPVNESPSGSV